MFKPTITCMFIFGFTSLLVATIISIPILYLDHKNSQYTNSVCVITNVSVLEINCRRNYHCYNGIIYVNYTTIDNQQYDTNLTVLFKNPNRENLEKKLFEKFLINESLDCYYKINNPEQVLLELFSILPLCIFALVWIIVGSLILIVVFIIKIKIKSNNNTDTNNVEICAGSK